MQKIVSRFRLPRIIQILEITAVRNTVFFLVLFFLYSLRAPADLFTPYLWAEDGSVLIQRAIDDSWRGLIMIGNGTYWFLQHLLGLLSYNLLRLFSDISLLPQVMSVIAKAAVTVSILYFTSKRFEWVIKGVYARFLTCIFIVLLIPQNTYDVLTCDTSMPFGLFFAAFLIGLDLLCGKEAKIPNIGQTVFLSLLCLSYAGAPLIAAFTGLAALRWLICRIRENNLNVKEFSIHAVKLLVIFITAGVQSYTVLMSGRATTEIDFLDRMQIVLRRFTVFPYWEFVFNFSLLAAIAGIIIWVFVIYLFRIPKQIAVYCGVFSYVSLLLNSFALPLDSIRQLYFSGRYIMLSYQIVTLLLCIAASRLLSGEINIKLTVHIKRAAAVILILIMTVASVKTYEIAVYGAELSDYYKNYNDLFVPEGEERMWIPVGPWDPYIFTLPVNISSKIDNDDLSAEVRYISPAASIEYYIEWHILPLFEDGRIPIRLLVNTEDAYYPSLEHDGMFIVKTHYHGFDGNYEVSIIVETDDGQLHRTGYALTTDMQAELGFTGGAN